MRTPFCSVAKKYCLEKSMVPTSRVVVNVNVLPSNLLYILWSLGLTEKYIPKASS